MGLAERDGKGPQWNLLAKAAWRGVASRKTVGWRQELGFIPAEALGPVYSSDCVCKPSKHPHQDRPELKLHGIEMAVRWRSQQELLIGPGATHGGTDPSLQSPLGQPCSYHRYFITHTLLEKETFYSGTLGSLCTSPSICSCLRSREA